MINGDVKILCFILVFLFYIFTHYKQENVLLVQCRVFKQIFSKWLKINEKRRADFSTLPLKVAGAGLEPTTFGL